MTTKPKPVPGVHLLLRPIAQLRIVKMIGACVVEVALEIFWIGLSMALRIVMKAGTCLVEVAQLIFKLGLCKALRIVKMIGTCVVEVD